MACRNTLSEVYSFVLFVIFSVTVVNFSKPLVEDLTVSLIYYFLFFSYRNPSMSGVLNLMMSSRLLFLTRNESVIR